MIPVNQSDINHKVQLQRLLVSLVDDNFIPQNSYFKGGTCAEMSGFLDRFSVDLDFDLKKGADIKIFRSRLEKIAKKLNLVDNNKNTKSLFFTYKYKSLLNQRNTLKLSFFGNEAHSSEVVASNDYETRFLPEIDRAV